MIIAASREFYVSTRSWMLLRYDVRRTQRLVSAPFPSVTADVASELAPGGVLRAGLNLGNPVIVQRDDDGALGGIGPSLARELARHVGARVAFSTYETAGKLAEAVREHAWDVAFLAIDPERAVDIAFTGAYVHIEGTYLVAEDSPLELEDFDRGGVTIAVGLKTAYDLHLTRTLRHATLVREATSKEAIDAFLAGRVDAVAGVRQPLEATAARIPGLRVIDGHFMVIRQAAGVPKGRSGAHRYVSAFIEHAKRSGFAAQALRDSGVEGAAIAPPV
jgi:polar amino acid transport system substrate-binding protein